MELFPRIASISGSVDSSHFSLNQDDIIGVAAPQDVNQLTVNFKDVETNFVSVHSINGTNAVES